MYMTKITLPALLLSAVLAAPAQNLLQNGDFENDVAHWRSSGDPASVKTEIHEGSKALVLSGRGVKLGAADQILSRRNQTDSKRTHRYAGDKGEHLHGTWLFPDRSSGKGQGGKNACPS